MVPVGHVRMGSTGVRAPVWTASGMGHWKRVIKIPGGTDFYYCVNHMTCLIHVYYLVTVPVILSTIMFTVILLTCYCSLPDTCFLVYSCTSYCAWSFSRYHVTCLFVTLPDTCYTFCSSILFHAYEHIFYFLYTLHTSLLSMHHTVYWLVSICPSACALLSHHL